MANTSYNRDLYPAYNDVTNYYGEEFDPIDNEARRGLGHTLIGFNSAHIRTPNKADKIVSNCKGENNKQCFPVKYLFTRKLENNYLAAFILKQTTTAIFVNLFIVIKKLLTVLSLHQYGSIRVKH